MLRDRLLKLCEVLNKAGINPHWEERHGDAIEFVNAIDLLRQTASTLTVYEKVSPEQERVAWDQYAAGYIASIRWARDYDMQLEPIAKAAGRWADQLLAERRKRFGSSEPEPK